MKAGVVIVGGGVAGCSAALAAARWGAEVLLLTRLPDPGESNTRYAQGGIIYTGPNDAPELLVRDVLAAGAGASDRRAAQVLAREGPELVRRILIRELEVPFERNGGGFHLTREAAHSVARILHHRDATGRAIQDALTGAVLAEPRVTVLPASEALELAVSQERCVGVHVVRDGQVETLAGLVVLATGGLGALYEHTTNPPAATGDGVALALRAGARVRDLHYVQFHPTALYTPEGGRFLISEAVRGEGGVLRDPAGEEFVSHPLGSLAPRDVVAREVWRMMRRTGSPCAYLDATHLPELGFEKRFPTIHARCREAGIDPAREPIPVVPAAHYSCGGVATDLSGRTSLPGLWAAGEVASTGLHGANRLASTSLLEGLVWGWHAGEDAAGNGPVDAPTPEPPALAEPNGAGTQNLWERLRATMWERAGLVRSAAGLERGLEELNELKREAPRQPELPALRLRRALEVARAVFEAALDDPRSRGCHYREETHDRGRVRVGRP